MRFKINVVAGRDLTSDLIATWRELQCSNPALASPYFCPEFTQSVAVAREDVEIAVMEDGGRVISFLPYQRGLRGIASPVGGLLSDFQGIVAEPGIAFDPLELLKQCRLKAWDFDHLLASQEHFVGFHQHREPSPQIDVSHGYNVYVAERRAAGSDQIKRCANLARRIEREVGPLRFVNHAADTATLAQVLAWKSKQYVASGKQDLFALTWTRRLVGDIHAMQTEYFAGMLSLLYAGERLIAGHFGMRSRTVWHYWFPSYDKTMAKYSPGLLLLLKMAEDAQSLGIGVIDLGKGISSYKVRFMNASIPVASGSVELPSWRWFRRQAQRRIRALVKSVLSHKLILSRGPARSLDPGASPLDL